MKIKSSIIVLNQKIYIIKDLIHRKKLSIWKDKNKLGRRRQNLVLDKYDKNILMVLTSSKDKTNYLTEDELNNLFNRKK